MTAPTRQEAVQDLTDAWCQRDADRASVRDYAASDDRMRACLRALGVTDAELAAREVL